MSDEPGRFLFLNSRVGRASRLPRSAKPSTEAVFHSRRAGETRVVLYVARTRGAQSASIVRAVLSMNLAIELQLALEKRR